MLPQGTIVNDHPTTLEQHQLVKTLKNALRGLMNGACATLICCDWGANVGKVSGRGVQTTVRWVLTMLRTLRMTTAAERASMPDVGSSV